MKAPDKIFVLPEVASVVKVLDEEVEYIRADLVDSLQKEQKPVDLEKLALEKYPETMTYDSRGLYDRKKYDRGIYKQGLKDGYNLKHKIRNDDNNL